MNAPTTQPPSKTWSKGFSHVLIVAIMNPTRHAHRPWRSYAQGALIACFPLIAFAFDSVLQGSARFAVVIVGMSVMTFMTMAASLATWRFVHHSAELFDDLWVSAHDRALFNRWLDKQYGQGRQIRLSIASAALASVYLFYVAPSMEQIVPVTASSYFSIAWTALIGSNSLYWMWNATGLIGIPFSQAKNLNVSWYEPARTPAVVAIFWGLLFSLTFLFIGLSVLTVLVLVAPTFWLSPAVFPIMLMIGVVAAVFIARTFWALFFVVAKRTSSEIRRIRRLLAWRVANIDPEDAFLWNDARTMATLDLYKKAVEFKSLPINEAVVVAFSSATVGSLVGFAVSLVFTDRPGG